jgi:ribose 5-phosphate isomerase B
MKTIWVASDHAGFELKQKVVSYLKSEGPSFASRVIQSSDQVQDLGPVTDDPVDYPDFADLVAQKIQKDPTENIGVLICGSGQGMSIRANRYPKVRAALVYSEQIAALARQHNDANVICLGGRVTDHDLSLRLVKIFLETKFEGGRHQNRLLKLERKILC